MSRIAKAFSLVAIVVFSLIRVDAKTVPPNILVLLADDLGYSDLSCYGSRSTQTPQLDQLAASGMRFTDFYAPAPNCSPSRAGLLTGRSPSRTGMYSYIPANGPHYLPRSEITIAELLRDAGYNTAHMGKWHLCHDMCFLKRAKLTQFELFNLRTDLAQTTDLSRAQPERFLAMKQKMIELHREVVAEGPRWFQ